MAWHGMAGTACVRLHQRISRSEASLPPMATPASPSASSSQALSLSRSYSSASVGTAEWGPRLDDRRPSRRGACRRWACRGDAADACAEPEKCLKTSRATRIPEKKEKRTTGPRGTSFVSKSDLVADAPALLLLLLLLACLSGHGVPMARTATSTDSENTPWTPTVHLRKSISSRTVAKGESPERDRDPSSFWCSLRCRFRLVVVAKNSSSGRSVHGWTTHLSSVARSMTVGWYWKRGGCGCCCGEAPLVLVGVCCCLKKHILSGPIPEITPR
mmetsp:Transcript_109436/g.223641  ORF Transcript_109436/g.223641 Transcript_109436/m.223641 type:complete len:273 (+) Transcript_109436:391-1209(+)